MIKILLILVVGAGIWFFVTGKDIVNPFGNTDFVGNISETMGKTKDTLMQKKEKLEEKIELLSQEIAEKKDNGLERMETIETSLSDAQKSYNDVMESLQRLQGALNLKTPLEEEENTEK